ncbi:DHA2 family efflux MFS transporter permease subunit [Thorsellia anophelis]|uniref:MFS transporter, DHA2 family, multidrug resistance protein n=1 Tax=Thorsellia anophelis DSM 18579 TaxID=1123402 RepID=A0A1I0DGD5_9GAMM|nr:DHA2 family efflux MFS transporter permease subunit [Thorsellia anophelis]SET31463.1 MFS transporter, DHA2 family, multidrug resistance protein [Thorsellia anophelis DSM 18579]
MKPLEGRQLGWLTIALSLATFMQVLDGTIANVALPTIAGNLGASTTQGTWVITSFGVANAISIPITGWLAKRIGEVRLFLWSTALFVLASWLCGISSSLGMLIFFRIIQGLVAGPMMPLAQSLLLNNYPPLKRNMALALWSMTVIVAPIFGPILGGYISDNYHWGWIFFINIPIGLLVVLAVFKLLHNRETKIEIRKIDFIGLMLLVLGVGSLQLMLDQGKELDWFNSPLIIGLTICSIITLIALVIWELTDDNPVIDLSLFKSRNFTIATLCVCLAFVFYYGSMVLIPQLLQSVVGFNATWAGLAAAPIGLIPIILAPIIGKLGTKIDMRILVTFSFIVYAATFLWRALTFETGMGFATTAWPQFFQGFAIACFFMPLTTIMYSGLSSDKIAAASSLSGFMRTMAGSIGASIVANMWSSNEATHHTILVESISPYNPLSNEIFAKMMSLGMSYEQVAAYWAKEITNQSLIMAANDIFTIAAAAFIALIVLVWFAKPPFTPGGNSTSQTSNANH